MNNIHFKAQSGWINDPNGLCYFKGQYHIFYQYFPYDLEWGTMHWGHATTTDFINYQHHPIALFPSIEHDQNGVFSGSSFIENDTMNLFYTGVKYNNFGNDIHRYGDKLFNSSQLKITSSDGFTFDNFKDKEIVLDVLERPEGDPIHTRDPKVWKKNDKYYMLLGSNIINDENNQGCLLFYESDDLTNFKQIAVFTIEDLGHMWECPDYFEIEEDGFVVMSPEGTMPNCEYPSHVQIAKAKFNYKDKLNLESDFKLIDIGLDCYAPQTFEDEDGVRTLISWIRMPKPIEDNSIGCFTMPRTIRYEDDAIKYQVHDLIQSKFKLDTIEPLNKEETYKFELSLTNGSAIELGKYIISLNDNCLRFDRSELFPLNDKCLKVIEHHIASDNVKLEIYYDGYVVETFIDGGIAVCTHILYDNKLEIKTDVSYLTYKLEK